MLFVLLAGCAASQARETIHSCIFAGANPEGDYRYVELYAVEGETSYARAVTTRQRANDEASLSGGQRPDEQSSELLEPEQVKALVTLVRNADDRPGPAVPEVSGSGDFDSPVRRLHFDPAARPSVEIAGGGRFELRFYQGDASHGGDVAAVSVAVPGTSYESVAGEQMLLPGKNDGNYVGELLVLPGGSRALLVAGTAAHLGGALYRLDALAACNLQEAAAGALSAQGLALLESRQDPAAEEALVRSIQLWPNSTAQYNLACAFARQKKIDRALEALRAAIEADPSRLRSLAAMDPDLSALFDQPEFKKLIAPR